MNEAKASLNTFVLTKTGYNLQITLRGDDEFALLDRFGELVKRFNELQITPKAVGQQPKSSVIGAPSVYSPIDPNAPLESIEIDTIALASGGDHPRWVVRGGWAKEYGITCWPETLKAAGLLDKLDPMKENLIDKGYVAYYSKKQKKDDPSKTTADKVVRIEVLGAAPDDIVSGKDEEEMPW